MKLKTANNFPCDRKLLSEDLMKKVIALPLFDIKNIFNGGWTCFFNAMNSLTENDLTKEIFIRNQAHTITEAINRQLAHYPYHIGQIVFIGKFLCNGTWSSLSIPKGSSKEYNAEKFAQPKHT